MNGKGEGRMRPGSRGIHGAPWFPVNDLGENGGRFCEIRDRVRNLRRFIHAGKKRAHRPGSPPVCPCLPIGTRRRCPKTWIPTGKFSKRSHGTRAASSDGCERSNRDDIQTGHCRVGRKIYEIFPLMGFDPSSGFQKASSILSGLDSYR